MDVKPQSPPIAAAPADPAPSDDEAKEREGPLGFALFLVKLLVLVLVFRSLVFSPFSIPSESMLPRLWNGDYLLAAKWPYGFSHNSLPFDAQIFTGRIFASEPERGDVVIFKHPLDRTDYVKRVIGLPGDTVALTRGRVVLNGAMLPRDAMPDFEIALSPNTVCAWGGEEAVNVEGEPVCRYDRFRETLPGGREYEVLDFGPTPGDGVAPTTVPAGHMFVLGDNRDNSRDSRFEAREGDAVGIVPLENLVGRASVIMWSTDGGADWAKPWTWIDAARVDRIGRDL